MEPQKAGVLPDEADGFIAACRALAAADLVVNATPLGMNEGDGSPFDVGLLSAGQTVFDAVYGHGETALVRAAREAGCTVHDGAGMLVAQAVATVHAVCDLAEVDVRPAIARELVQLGLPTTVMDTDARDRAHMAMLVRSLIYSIDPLAGTAR